MSTTYKNKALALERQRAAERAQDRSGFTSRNYWLYVVIVFLALPICTGISIFTEGFNYYSTWASALGMFRTPSALVFALFINLLVIMLGKGVVDDIQDGVFSSKFYDKSMFVIKSLVFMGALYWSVTNSLAGAPHLRLYVQESHQPVALLLTDPGTVNAEYEDRRQQQLDIIKSARNTTWKGNITAAAMKTLRAAQAELSKLDAAIAADRAKIDEANALVTADYNAEVAEAQEGSVLIAGLGQLGQLICVLIIGLWNKGVEDEADIETEGAAAGARTSEGEETEDQSVILAGFDRMGQQLSDLIMGLLDKQAEGATAGAMRGGKASANAGGIGFNSSAAATHTPANGPSADPTALPPSAGRSPIGFKHYEATPSPTPAITERPTVATRRDIDDDANPDSLAAQSRLAAWRSHSRNLASYATRAQTKSAVDAAAQLEKLMAHEEEELARMGLRIVLQESPRKAYILVPIAEE